MTPEEMHKSLAQDYLDFHRRGWNEALEEAARLCEETDPEKPSRWEYRREELAAAIRALKEDVPHP